MRMLAAGLVLIVPHLSFAQRVVSDQDYRLSQSQIEDFGEPLGAAQSSTPRPLNELSMMMIKSFEHWVPAHYDDPAGYCTIGYGHLIALKSCEMTQLREFSSSITLAVGDQLLDADLRTPRLALQKLVKVDLTDGQFGALSSFVFNIGKTHFQNSTLLDLLNYGDFKAAAKQFQRWVIAGGQVMNGLIERRACEAAAFRGELLLNNDGRFDPRLCTSLGAAPNVGSLIDVDKGE